MRESSDSKVDRPSARKARGAFFTPPAIADFLATWAVRGESSAKVLDPTCGEAVFLQAAARCLREAGCPAEQLGQQVYGVDIHPDSLKTALDMLHAEGLDARLLPATDFFDVRSPGQLNCPLPEMDAVLGNPPFVRYQQHAGVARRKSIEAALRQGVSLSGLASSWAATLVHACSFLNREGRLAMVLPAELLTVHYAEPIRRWLRQRFKRVHLVMFEQLQFAGALEKVVLLVASGSGGCDAFALHYIHDASDLYDLHPFDNDSVTPAKEGKWSDLLLSSDHRRLFQQIEARHFCPLRAYGAPELGTVTGGNRYFTLTEETRQRFGLIDGRHVCPTSPPGTKHIKGISFTEDDWISLKEAGQAVWLLWPENGSEADPKLRAYIVEGERLSVHEAYKCTIRTPWYRPPRVPPPDLFFTYMSHRQPRLITNEARTTFVNSMHGIRLAENAPKTARTTLPLLAINSVTALGAELYGRSYGGGVLKMEPREAALLPVPQSEVLNSAWQQLAPERTALERQLRQGLWTEVSKRVDQVLLCDVIGLSVDDAESLREAARSLREHRLGSPAGRK